MFTCKECGGPVSVENGIISRACGHDTSGVLASISGHATGQGGTLSRSQFLREKFRAGLNKVVDKARKQREG